MSEIIDTGQGWWANEDWLKDNTGYMGEINSGEFDSLKIPFGIGMTTASQIRANGYPAINVTGTSYFYFLITAGTEDVYMARFLQGNTNPKVIFLSTAPFTVSRAMTGNPNVYNNNGVAQSGIYYFQEEYSSNYIYDTSIKDYGQSTRANVIADFKEGGGTTNFYKLNSGFAISCFMRWLNANQEEIVAPILVSTVSEYTKISLDGQTEAPGIVTGIEFGEMTFYVNILLGYSGDVTASVPYQDITATFPAGINITELFRAIATFAQIRFSEPYQEGGISGPGGGGGTFDNTSVPVDFPGLPTLSATDTGFITLFNPSKAELAALSDYMWNNPLFDLDTWKKIIADPMDAILGLAIVPVTVTPGTSKTLKIGNIATSVSMTEAARQYEELDCGTLTISEYWGAYLDYDPYTKAEIYLPYIGTHPISVDDIMGKPLHIKYHVDILSGACCAYIKCGDSVLYTFMGQCASSIPIAAKDLTNVINGVLSAASSIGAMVATGGASAPSAVPGLVSTATNALKPHIEKSGSMSGTGGMLGPQTPYLIITRPRQALPGRQHEFIGYPAFETVTLGSLSGYTEVESIHPENIPATKAELTEIETLLGNGVIF